jgi:ribose 5-phosphate isomerase A
MTETKVASAQQLDRIGRIAALRVKPGWVVGLGSGKAALAFVRALADRVRKEGLQITGVPTSELTAAVARQGSIHLATLDTVDRIDLDVDGADEVTPQLHLLKGGGGNLLREKVIASISESLIIVVGEEKLTPRLGERFPVFVEVVQFAMPTVQRRLIAMGAASADPRPDKNGGIFLTDNGNPLLHAYFSPDHPMMQNLDGLDAAIHAIPGAVETGLFASYASEVIVAMLDGSVDLLTRASRRRLEPSAAVD